MSNKISVFNPTSDDFTVTYDVKGDGSPEIFTVPAYKGAEFDEVIANHVKKHLVNHIMIKRNINPLHVHKKDEIMAEISVNG